MSVTVPRNPTGQVMAEGDLRRLAELAERAGCRLLVHETYRELTFGDSLPCAATLTPQAISVSSLSKTYGIPGMRTGWLITRDTALMTTFLAAKEQIGFCGSVVDEAIAVRALEQRDVWLPKIHSRIAQALAATRGWMSGEEPMELHRGTSTVRRPAAGLVSAGSGGGR